MKRTSWLLIAVLGSVTYVCAQDTGQATTHDTGQATTMVGMLCNSKCVTQSSGQASCDQNCAEKSGEIVLIDDKGEILKISNQEKVAEYTGKKVKMSCRRMKGAEDTMYVDTVSLYGGGG